MIKQKTVQFTMITLILIGITTACIVLKNKPASNPIDEPSLAQIFKNSPTVGNSKAANHIILFEDLACPGCQFFHQFILPKVKTNLIDTNKARFTTVLVQLHPKTAPAITVAQCLNQQNTQYFTTFTNGIYKRKNLEESNFDNPLKMVTSNRTAYPNLNLKQLTACTQQDNMKKIGLTQLRKMETLSMKYHWYKNNSIATPTVLVNGSLVGELSYDNILKKIKSQ